MTVEFFLLYFLLGYKSWLACRSLLENSWWLKRMILVLSWSRSSVAFVVVTVYVKQWKYLVLVISSFVINTQASFA